MKILKLFFAGALVIGFIINLYGQGSACMRCYLPDNNLYFNICGSGDMMLKIDREHHFKIKRLKQRELLMVAYWRDKVSAEKIYKISSRQCIKKTNTRNIDTGQSEVSTTVYYILEEIGAGTTP